MTRNDILEFKRCLPKDPRKVRALLQGFYGRMMADIGHSEAGAIEDAAGLLAAFGFGPHTLRALARPHYRNNALLVVAVGTFLAGPAAGHSTLSLGERIVNSGPDWAVSEPLSAYVVRDKGDEYYPGQKLGRIPRGAVDVDEFFEKLNGVIVLGQTRHKTV